jgi:hypothetical protein
LRFTNHLGTEMDMPLSKRLAAEFIGTFWLVPGGCGSAVLAVPGCAAITYRRLGEES